jgi:hypothetical protein
MGQAAVDLPDPLSAAPVSSASTDDLLAQLAGEEIERLLAEADEPPAPSRASTDLNAPGSSPAVVPSQSTDISTLSSFLEPPTHSVAPVAKTSAFGQAADGGLDSVFSQIENAPPSHSRLEGTPAGLTTSVPDSAPSAAEALAQEMLEDSATSPSGRGALASSAGVSTTTDAHRSPRHEQDAGSMPIYLRILDWMNRPLDPYPDHVRHLVGKIAILTTVNAAAVLAYVLIFRNH